MTTPLQKTSFSTANEFVSWLALVNEIADKPIQRVSVTRATLDMLIAEWANSRKYEWTKYKFASSDTGEVLLSTPWGPVFIEEG